MAEHTHKTDVAEHQRTFEHFVRFWAYFFASCIAVLIFLAMVNA